MSFPKPRRIKTPEVTLAVYENDGDTGRRHPPVIFVHGWPEIAYSWKSQLGAVAKAGFRAIAIDLKGFGWSDAPKDPALYSAEQMTGDFVALMDALSIEKAIFCGHDWGGALVWAMAQLRPERVAGVIGLCTPVHPRPPAPPLAIINKRFGSQHYFVQFQTRDVPEQLFASDPDRFFRLMFQRPPPRDRWAELVPRIYDLPGRFKNAPPPSDNDVIIPPADIQIYVDAYKKSGFHGGVNLYRNIDRNWEAMEGRDETVRAPALWIGAELDLFLPPESAEKMKDIVPDLESHVIADCGHWMTWEKPAETNALIIDWLKRRFSA
ncbi:alpha/beta hydrolase [Hyphococcus flavus]|uniref:Alpha/beta hydrolase n=1 Tax=Hyphococcus flavus TaxID=1866326 RepID=A0AAE9ZH64_9PROT|nr:alpha/beta hydrolase [Hyphococcus flavus]WDI32452.1 alpha/beta hydrolase [Hyphococcus flavus]